MRAEIDRCVPVTPPGWRGRHLLAAPIPGGWPRRAVTIMTNAAEAAEAGEAGEPGEPGESS